MFPILMAMLILLLLCVLGVWCFACFDVEGVVRVDVVVDVDVGVNGEVDNVALVR